MSKNNRREFLKKAGLGTIAIASVSKLWAREDKPVVNITNNKATPLKPNIVYINSHDTGRYIQPFGCDIPTPNIQKLANEGILFRQSFTTNPTCSASRASLLTGMYPHCNGMIGLAHRGFSLNDYNQHLVHTLSKAGYRTALSGIQHVASDNEIPAWEKIGYDEFISDPTRGANSLNEVKKWIENAPENPFYLEIGFYETHRDYYPTNWKDNPDQTLPPAPMPDVPEVRKDMSEFISSARILDDKMGIVFDTLHRLGLEKNTLVICTTDHGIAFPRMKCNLTDSGTGIFLIMRGPGGFTGGKEVDSLISNVDIFPTICEYLNIPTPEWVQGKSFMPIIRGEKEEINEEIYGEVNYHAAYEPMRCVRTKRYKYIKRYDGRTKPVLCNIDDGLSKTVWMNAGFGNIAPAEEQLYDLILDPNEMNNLIHDENSKMIADDMRKRLQSYMDRTNDPLLKGKMIAPKNAVANNPDSISPNDKTETIDQIIF